MSSGFADRPDPNVSEFQRSGEARGMGGVTALQILRRRGWLLVLCVVLAIGAGVGVLLHSHKQYSATATLLFQNSQVTQSLFGNYAISAEDDPTTEQANNLALAEQPGIAVGAAKSLGSGYAASAVAGAIAVTAAGASDLIQVTATTESPQAAAAIANAYANATVSYQVNVQRQQINEAAANLSKQIAAESSASSAARSALETRLLQLRAISALQTGNVQITTPATVPGSPSGPSKPKDLALALVVGLLVGLFAMLVSERMDATVKEPSDIAEILHLPVLGTVPASREFGRSASRSNLDVLHDPVIADAFALLVAQLQYFKVDKDVRSLAIASSASGEGKSTVALGLAALAARTRPDTRVLLVDADLRRPGQARLTGTSSSPGLAEAVLRDDADLSDFIQEVSLRLPDGSPSGVLHIMTAGSPVPNPAELLSSEAFRKTLTALEEEFSLVVVDASSTVTVPDAIPLLSHVSGVLIVTRIGVTTRSPLRNLIKQLSGLGVPVFGVVHNATARVRPNAYQKGGAYQSRT